MSTPFAELLARVREGDGQAAEELVRRYEPMIRITIRSKLHDSRLRRVVDSMDICQSVMANFFTRAAFGEFDLEAPDQLIALLVKMAKNKVISQERRAHSEKRDVRRLDLQGDLKLQSLEGERRPDVIVADRELIALIRERLSEEELNVADRRACGDSWQEVAEALGGTAEGRRKQLSRALQRVLKELGMEEGDDDD